MFKSTHPMLFNMALDYLLIQASAVPSKQVFSSSAEMDTIKHNRIHPHLMEALQMLKFGVYCFVFTAFLMTLCMDAALKKMCLDFTKGWITEEKEMMEVVEPDIDMLALMLEDDGNASFDALLVVLEGNDGQDM